MAILALFGFDESGQFRLTAEPPAAEAHAGLDQALAPGSPDQAALPQSFDVALPDRYVATATHTFEATGLVLGRKRYPRGRMGDLAPVDLALGWGPMSNPEVLATLRLWQDRRFLYTAAGPETLITLEAATLNSANIHIVPATVEARRQMESIRKGDLVRVTGHLVNITGPRGFNWESSISRSDTGFGACELLLLERIEVRRASTGQPAPNSAGKATIHSEPSGVSEG